MQTAFDIRFFNIFV